MRAGAVHDLLDRELEQHHERESGGEGEGGAAAPREPGDHGEHGPDAGHDLGAAEQPQRVGERLAGEGPVLHGVGGGEVAGEAVVERGEDGERDGGSQDHAPARPHAPVGGKLAQDRSS